MYFDKLIDWVITIIFALISLAMAATWLIIGLSVVVSVINIFNK